MGALLESYKQRQYVDRKKTILLIFLLISSVIFSLSYGELKMSVMDIFYQKEGCGESMMILMLRLPRTVTAIAAGWGLAVSGTLAQSYLRNPLASPFTLGISNAAAFGAAVFILLSGAYSVDFMNSSASISKYALPLSAFFSAGIAAFTVILISRIKKYSPSSIILAGVALSSIFMSGTVVTQFFADDTELAGIVFWAFGDVSRPLWDEIYIMLFFVFASTVYAVLTTWNINAVEAGDDTAGSLGVNVDRSRAAGVLVSSAVAAAVVAFCGVIAFVGLIAPHIAQRLTFSNSAYRFVISGLSGSIIMVVADILARNVFSSGAVPVGVFTSFLGAPLFLYLLIKRGDN